MRNKHGQAETAEAFDARYEKYFSRPDIDGWEIRKAMNDLQVGISANFFFFASTPCYAVRV